MSGLDAIRRADGRIGVLAIDHRDSLRAVVSPEDPAAASSDDIRHLKYAVLEGMADLATGVMLENEYTLPDAITDAMVPDGVGVIGALENQGYLDDPSSVVTTIAPDWGPEQVRAAGADVAKLLLHWRPDGSAHADDQQRIAATVVDRCREAGVDLVLEPVPYGPDVVPGMHLEAARTFAPMKPPLLKVAFPGPGRCAEITECCAGRPWALLSAGVTFARYAEQVAEAVEAGASGFMAGRAVWREVATAAPDERADVAREIARPRFEQLIELLGG